MRKTSLLRPRLIQRLRWLLLMCLLTTCCAGLSSAPVAAQTPPSEAQLVVGRKVIEQCAQDAARVDGLESRLKACQRDLDQGFGERQECRRGAEAERERAVKWELRARELEKRSPWPWVALGAGAASAVWIAVMLIAK